MSNIRQFMITADNQCFSKEPAGTTTAHKETNNALLGIMSKVFRTVPAQFEGEWKDGGNHSCINSQILFFDLSQQSDLVQEFARVVEALKSEDNALPDLKKARVISGTEEDGTPRISIADPDDERYGGEIVEPTTPSAG